MRKKKTKTKNKRQKKKVTLTGRIRKPFFFFTQAACVLSNTIDPKFTLLNQVTVL